MHLIINGKVGYFFTIAKMAFMELSQETKGRLTFRRLAQSACSLVPRSTNGSEFECHRFKIGSTSSGTRFPNANLSNSSPNGHSKDSVTLP